LKLDPECLCAFPKCKPRKLGISLGGLRKMG
jgi:hypothetical protein